MWVEMKRILEEKGNEGANKRRKTSEYEAALQKVEDSLWEDEGTVDLKRCEELEFAGSKMQALYYHMEAFPTDFPPKFLPVLRQWIKNICGLSHFYEERDSYAEAGQRLRLGNGRIITIEAETLGNEIVRLKIYDDKEKCILRLYDELVHMDEARWKDLILHELPTKDVECPGESFMLRFFCFLCFHRNTSSIEYGVAKVV